MEENISKIKVIVSCSEKFHAFDLCEQLERLAELMIQRIEFSLKDTYRENISLLNV